MQYETISFLELGIRERPTAGNDADLVSLLVLRHGEIVIPRGVQKSGRNGLVLLASNTVTSDGSFEYSLKSGRKSLTSFLRHQTLTSMFNRNLIKVGC